VVLGVSVLFKLKSANAKLWGTVCMISVGVAVASYGRFRLPSCAPDSEERHRRD
jgi:hypothetical protein